MVVEPPAGTVTRYRRAALVPSFSGLTVEAPCSTWLLMPSFGYGVMFFAPNTRASFVSFSQNKGSGSPSPNSTMGTDFEWLPTIRLPSSRSVRFG